MTLEGSHDLGEQAQLRAHAVRSHALGDFDEATQAVFGSRPRTLALKLTNKTV